MGTQSGQDALAYNGHVDTYFRCARCPAPALLTCAIETTALGLGEVRVYLCQQDYDLVLAREQGEMARQAEVEEERAQFAQLQQAILAAALQHFGGVLPSRKELWSAYNEAERRSRELRKVYQDADDASPAARHLRLQLLRKAGEAFALALCIEARAQQDGTSDSVVSGTLYSQTMAFFRSGGLVLREKEITQREVAAAARAIMRVRASQSVDEVAELRAVEEALQEQGSEQA